MKYLLRKLLILMAFTYSIQALAEEPGLKFVGHRGASYLAPENTKASIQLAWELGADGAECDIMLTKDQKIVLFHDDNTKRLAGENLVIAETDFADLKDLTINLEESNLEKYSGEHIPLLTDVLPLIPADRMLVIEIKTGPEILEHLEPIINDHWKTGRIAFICFDYETIIATKELFPEVPCYYLSSFKSDIKKRFDEIAGSNLDGVDLRHNIIDNRLVKKLNDQELEVWCWTVNDPKTAVKMNQAGVTHITTDRPAWLKEKLLESM